MNELELLKEYAKCLEEEHRFYMEEWIKRPNKELDESLNDLSEEAQFLLMLMLLDDIVRKQNEQTHPEEKANTET